MTPKRFLYLLLRKVLLHSLFWTAVLLFFSYFFEYNNEDIKYISSFSAFLMPVTIGTTYTVIYYLIPKFLLLKKYLLFVLYSIYTLILSAFAIVISIFYGLIFLMGLQYGGIAPLSRSLLFIMVVVYLVVLLVSAFTLLKCNYSSVAKNKELKNKILEAQLKLKEQELHYLKSQVHPHFLFNTLNTMYGYAIKKSDQTPDMILKLSNLLDYLLYQVDKPMVSLADEVEHIKDYIALEQIRFRDTLFVDLDIPEIAGDIYIAPMLLIPFIENSFKHGDIVDNQLKISIYLKTDDRSINLYVRNSIKTQHENSREKGIGLENVKKRLCLLYQDNYTLSIKKDQRWFEAELSLNHTNIQASWIKKSPAL